MKVALVTYDAITSYGSLSGSEDGELLNYLTAQGLDITPQVWDDPAVDWAQFDLAIFKSPWDYFDKFPAFWAWLDRIEALGLRTLNPLATIRWNVDKHYLLEVEKAGLPIVPTALLKKGTAAHLEEFYGRFQTDKLIVKPSVSGGAKNTFIVSRAEAGPVEQKLEELLREEDFLVQPFMPQIQEEGEWSFLFFNGTYSHCLLKSAKSGDFRVQHFFGGTIHPQPAPAHLLPQAQKLVDQFAKGCLYARVDGVVVGQELQLMELELIEPFLFLHTHPQAMENYYQALKELR
ncbi:RimK family alpha-L-glutamate ligase [Rufibacter glacialis]|uniref:RimK family alpha-L-glutamate ligase n=1 Tax=Rufibacter glacialis TaxID=1259555 RepID=A0A5M8QQT5_9BACT|nr:hypothetical protein [Rufibacter glacialis]KAA6437410.1 hypothetical protein FOE74_02600 [Rufibacter glacialis]GGK59506.1 hypothetical protein GCM10011405_04560 [Rufibacter glacialis]